MSPSGLRFETARPVNVGTKVCVDLAQGLAFGEIRYCLKKNNDTYSLGFLLEEYIAQPAA